MSHTASHPRTIWSVLAGCMLFAASAAQAQMVPKMGHLLSKMLPSQGGQGFSLTSSSAWPHWEGRIGVVMARSVDPVKDSFVLVQPQVNNGLSVRSLHVLSDYHFSGGFRATAGLLRGSLTQSSWTEPDGSGPGLNLSLQHLDTLTLGTGQRNSNELDNRTVPYVGAGYTLNMTQGQNAGTLRLNADVGVVSAHSSNLSRFIQGDSGVDEAVRDLRLEPLVKVSVQYAF